MIMTNITCDSSCHELLLEISSNRGLAVPLSHLLINKITVLCNARLYHEQIGDQCFCFCTMMYNKVIPLQ